MGAICCICCICRICCICGQCRHCGCCRGRRRNGCRGRDRDHCRRPHHHGCRGWWLRSWLWSAARRVQRRWGHQRWPRLRKWNGWRRTCAAKTVFLSYILLQSGKWHSLPMENPLPNISLCLGGWRVLVSLARTFPLRSSLVPSYTTALQ